MGRIVGVGGGGKSGSVAVGFGVAVRLMAVGMGMDMAIGLAVAGVGPRRGSLSLDQNPWRPKSTNKTPATISTSPRTVAWRPDGVHFISSAAAAAGGRCQPQPKLARSRPISTRG